MEKYQVFTRILKSLGCYGEYINNFKNMPRFIEVYDDTLSFKAFLKKIEQHRGPDLLFEYFINDSFDWSHTKQGHDYWSKINAEFKHLYKEHTGGYVACKSSLDEETKEAVFNYLNSC